MWLNRAQVHSDQLQIQPTTGAQGMRMALPCCTPQSLRQNIPLSQALGTHRSQRCRRLQRNWCRRWSREPGGKLAPRRFHTSSPILGCRSASPPACIAACSQPLVSGYNLSSQLRSNLAEVEMCTPPSLLARTRWSLQCGSLAPRSQKPPCSPLKPGSQDRSFDLLGRTGTQGCFRKSGLQHCCTVVWAHRCTPP